MDIDITDYRYDEDNHQLFIKRKLGSSEYELPFSDELDAKLHPKLLKYVISLEK